MCKNCLRTTKTIRKVRKMEGFHAAFGLFVMVLIGATDARSKYKIFEYNSSIRTWDEARAACQLSGANWDLVKIDNAKEDEAMKFMLATECNSGKGWFIGGKSKNGVWQWADGSPMVYNKFPNRSFDAIYGSPSTATINYAAIFQSDLQWDYVSPRPLPEMGYICESMHRTCSNSYQ